jgi:hypothetical protein
VVGGVREPAGASGGEGLGQSPSPHISGISWGQIIVESHGSFKDVKLFPGGAREWDWNETGTSHSRGVQPSDLDELLSGGARVVILGTGMLGRLRVSPETLEMLESKGVEAYVLNTKDAVRKYNAVRTEHPVGALLHSTC